VVPGNASGGMDGIALKPLTVSFVEPGFNAKLNGENQFRPWFMLSDKERQQLGNPMGPSNPQALNRYSYVQNNPVRYTDPSGHATSVEYDSNKKDRNGRTQSQRAKNNLDTQVNDVWNVGMFIAATGAALAGGAAAAMGAPPVTIIGGVLGGVALGVTIAVVVKEGQRVSGMMADAQGFLDLNGGGKMVVTINDDGTVSVEAYANQSNEYGENYAKYTTSVSGVSRRYLETVINGYRDRPA
jgi:YD repeat-containing protein